MEETVPFRPKRTLLRLLWLTAYTAFMYVLIKVSGKIRA